MLGEIGAAHGFSTRVGGVSAAPFESLNLGNPSDLPPERRDPAANIRENLRRLLALLGRSGAEVVQVHQVHGPGVLTVRAGRPVHAGTRDTKADAIVTDDPLRVLCVRVADCAPVLLASEDRRIVAAVHAGWRGVIAGVVPRAVEAMQTLGAAGIHAAVGPCIGPDHFKVGPEVASEFARVFGDGRFLRPAARPGRTIADLKGAILAQLRQAGVTRAQALPHCTYAEAGLFYSHRRDAGLTGRMCGLIAAG